MAKKKAKKSKSSGLITFIIIVLVLIIVAAAVLWYVRPDVFDKIFGSGQEQIDGDDTHGGGNTPDNPGGTTPEQPSTGAQDEISEAEFSIHVIDLGEYAGDSIYIKAGENDILIDAGSRAASAPLICEYLSNYVTDGKLEYVIATHADQDHIEAFAGNKDGDSRTGVLYKYDVDTLIKFGYVEKGKEDKENNSNTTYGKFMDAVKYVQSKGTKVYTAGDCYNEVGGAKRQYWLDSENTLSMNILYNYYYYNQSNDENNHSVVTLFTKQTEAGKLNYLFTGDLEKDGESKLVDYYSNPSNSKSVFDILPEVDFYKAGHHGSGTSSTAKLLDVIKPKYIAVSCCAGAPEYTLNNNNTFPYQASLDNMLRHTENIYCTGIATNLPELKENGEFVKKQWDYAPHNGNIVFYQVANELKLWCSNSLQTITETDWFKQYRSWNY